MADDDGSNGGKLPVRELRNLTSIGHVEMTWQLRADKAVRFGRTPLKKTG